MEQRQMLDADPVVAGITYLEGDLGQDNTPDFFEVTFEGGAATTQMTTFVINGDQDQSGGLSDGDMFFDINDSLPGTGGSAGFSFVAAGSHGINADDILDVKVSSDGLRLEVSLKNFEAGDKLVFSIDVDEVERFRVDKIASGVEFEGTFFDATFIDENYTFNPLNVATSTQLEQGVIQDQVEGIFYDNYDDLLQAGRALTGQTFDLQLDNQSGQADRSAAAIDAYELEPKPISISGNVFHDEDIDCVKDGTEEGIEGVLITLQRKTDSGIYETVATTRTDANGHYEFGENLGLKPGTFRLIESQPGGYLDVGADAGQVAGKDNGVVQNNANGAPNIIAEINIPLGNTAADNYNFCEVKPATLQGNVYHDRNDNGIMNPGEEGLANVLIQVTRIGAKSGTTNDPFAGSEPIFVRTDSNGHYEVTGLAPGVYQVTEINSYPSEISPLTGFIDGKDTVGQVTGQTVGTKVNDRFNSIVLCADEDGVEYNFGELKPTSISGYVSVTTPFKQQIVDPDDPNYVPIAGVTIQLYDNSNKLLETTKTDDNGFYKFDSLAPGNYSVVEVQPAGYFDDGASVGTVNGQSRGANTTQDRFSNVILRSGEDGVQFNFCETKPASISGFVVVSDPNEDCETDPTDPDFKPIEGVTIQLYDNQGQLVATTKTNASGYYEFAGLDKGNYSVVELQPEGYFDAGTHLGQVDGQTRGTVTSDNRFNNVTLGSGEQGVQYNFCEYQPASISGFVAVANGNKGTIIDPNAAGYQSIEGVTIQLFADSGELVATTKTNAQGYYNFGDLTPGTYTIVELQPEGYFDAGTSVGLVNGQLEGSSPTENRLENINLNGGERGIQYNFCEYKPASISGRVHQDTSGNCTFEPKEGDKPLADVTILLLDKQGNELARTTTDANGEYSFDGLKPGEYSIRELQPGGKIDGNSIVGNIDGKANGKSLNSNRINKIVLGSGDAGVRYDFCEETPAKIQGRVFQDGPAFETEDGNVPQNYRAQRDGIFQAATDKAIAGVRMQLYYYVDPDSDSIEPRAVTLADVVGNYYSHMGTNDPNAAIWVNTDSNGEYCFDGLRAGNYIVVEKQPDGYVDSNDRAGTTTGFTYNSAIEAQTAPQAVISTFSGEQLLDTVVNIRVNSGGISLQNNFSEVTAERVTDPPVVDPPPRDPPSSNPPPPSPPLSPGWGLAGNLGINNVSIIGSSRGPAIDALPQAAGPYTWHLSVVNGGSPRSVEANAQDATWLQASYLTTYDWTRFDMTEGKITYGQTNEDGTVLTDVNGQDFGMFGGIPLAGDFDGDSNDEIVLYKDGYWLIDINGNGEWDRDDLMAKLGDENDLPVVGDWDGDGKDDIGIFGPIWEGDQKAIEAEPGLPDPDNHRLTRPKNVPPTFEVAADGGRVMRLSSHGQSRIDVIDHVFGYGKEGDIPLVGDWNGDGIRTIGLFRDGKWQIDLNGDGKFDFNDAQFSFGRQGDIPIVGDFNGDGIEEVAIFRNGTWIVDVNGNRQIDAADKVFEMGGAGDLPVVGDWNGDGIDDPAIYNYNMSANHMDVRQDAQ